MPSFQTFREQARALALMPNYFQQIAAAPAKAKQMTAQRIAVKNFLNLALAPVSPPFVLTVGTARLS
jgi:hypothetical protein